MDFKEEFSEDVMGVRAGGGGNDIFLVVFGRVLG